MNKSSNLRGSPEPQAYCATCLEAHRWMTGGASVDRRRAPGPRGDKPALRAARRSCGSDTLFVLVGTLASPKRRLIVEFDEAKICKRKNGRVRVRVRAGQEVGS